MDLTCAFSSSHSGTSRAEIELGMAMQVDAAREAAVRSRYFQTVERPGRVPCKVDRQAARVASLKAAATRREYAAERRSFMRAGDERARPSSVE